MNRSARDITCDITRDTAAPLGRGQGGPLDRRSRCGTGGAVRATGRRGGFTLLETLLAVFLTAMLLILVAAAMNFYVRFVNVRRTQIAQAQVARAVLRQISNDVQATYYGEETTVSTASAEGTTGSTTAGSTTGASGTSSAGTTGTGGTAAGATGSGATGGTTTSSTTGSSTAGSTTTGSTASTTSTATLDMSTSAAQVQPGLYGNQYQLQIDLQQVPRTEQYDAILASGIDPRLLGVSSEPQTVTYYLRPMEPAELAAAGVSVDQESAAQGTRYALVRRVMSRAEASWATAAGDATLAMQQGEQLLADEVLALEFEYFDGLSWYTDWDSQTMAGLPLAVRVTIVVAVSRQDETQITSLSDVASMSRNTYQITVALPCAVPVDTTSTGTSTTTTGTSTTF